MAVSVMPRFRLNAIMRAVSGTGGLPARSWSVAGQMQVGMNAGTIGSYSGRRFANVLYDMTSWAPVVAGGAARTAGTWSQVQGTLIGDGDGTGTDSKYFRAKICDASISLPAGLYTIFNPSGQEFALGSFGGTGLVAWTTAKYVTFTYTPASSGMYLWCRRSLQNTGAGNLQVILPGAVGDGTVDTVNGVYLTNGTHGITSGNPWNPDFLTFCSGLNLQRERWMPTLRVIGSVETVWADRILPTGISFCSNFGNGSVIPHELVIDFSNRMGIDPWINFGSMTTSDYWTNCAALYKAGLNTNRRMATEYSNETWNYASAYIEDANWVAYLQFTKHVATVSDVSDSAHPVFYQQGHGRSVGDTIVLFATRENAPLTGTYNYYMQQGYSYTITSVIDADHFTLTIPAHTINSVTYNTPVGLVNICYAWAAEPGKTAANADLNHATQQMAIWDVFDSVMGVGRVVHSCASQASNASITSNRMSVGAMASRAEHVHIAPYYNGMYCQVVFTGGGSQITPSMWSSVAGTVYYGIYAAGSTPTDLDIARGAGTGFIVGSSQSVSSASTATGSPLTGLTDGTNYAAFAVFKETSTGFFWKIGTSTDPLNPTNVQSSVAAGAQVCFDTFANQAARCRLSQIASANDAAHKAAIAAAGGTATLITYEGGPDFNLSIPSTLVTWLLGSYFPSAAHATTFTHSYNHLARVGFRGHNHYLDCVGGGNVSSVGNENPYDLVPNSLFSATAVDGRYAAVAAFNGTVTAQAPIPSTVTIGKIAAAITAAPGSYPYTIYSGLPVGYTYSIVSGDWTGNFGISGTSVVMNNANGINFSGYSPETLTIEANDGYSSASFTLAVPIGSAWYESDAQFVWDSVGAAAGTTMVPPVNLPFASYGGTLSEVTGSGNPPITSSSGTVSNDLWKMATYVFANSTALPSNLPFYDASNTGIPMLVAHIVDIGDQTTTSSQYEMSVGASSSFIAFGTPGSASTTNWKVYLGSVLVAAQSDGTCPPKGTKAVHWCFVDTINGQVVTGINQTVGATTSTATAPLGATLAREVRIGSNNTQATSFSQMYHGSLEVLSRAGLTLAQAKAIVQNMQTHHGI